LDESIDELLLHVLENKRVKEAGDRFRNVREPAEKRILIFVFCVD
jgi:hypothetical protein